MLVSHLKPLMEGASVKPHLRRVKRAANDRKLEVR